MMRKMNCIEWVILVLFIMAIAVLIYGCVQRPTVDPSTQVVEPWRDLMSGQVSSVTLVGDRLEVFFQDGSRFTIRMYYIYRNEATLSKGSTIVVQYWNGGAYILYRFMKKVPENPDGVVR